MLVKVYGAAVQAYSGLRFSCRDKTQTTNRNLIL